MVREILAKLKCKKCIPVIQGTLVPKLTLGPYLTWEQIERLGFWDPGSYPFLRILFILIKENRGFSILAF